MSWIDDVIRDSGQAGTIFWSGETEFMGAAESDSVGRTLKLRLIRPAREQHLANPFAKATRRRGKRAGSRFELSAVDVETGLSAYLGESMLLNWASGPSGDNATLLLHAESDTHPFLYCRRASASLPGTRFMLALASIQDDEERVSEVSVSAAEAKQRGEQPLSVQAAIILKQPAFYRMLSEKVSDETTWDFASADAWLKQTCKIKSKSELTTNALAQTIFKKIRSVYSEYAEPEH